jgi:tRNA(Ile2) C34 agmatinyltransferase TiaS
MKKQGSAVQIQTFTVTRKVRLEEKVCPQCGTRFMGRLNKKFCSRACVQKASYETHGEKRRTSRRAKYHEEKRTAAGKK